MRRKSLSAFALAMCWLSGFNQIACAQPVPVQTQNPPAADAAPALGFLPPDDSPPRGLQLIQFNFKKATFEQVIEFFSRMTGLPVIWQCPAPEGTLDYISPGGYQRDEALRVLNMVLQSKGVMLRVSKDNLFLQKLDQMQREDVPTFVGKIPADITADQIVTVVRPLKMSMAKPLGEKLSSMVASYGSVVAMEQQNSLVITETAANAQRILSIVDQLDREDPDGAVEIFPIKHAKAAELMVPLKALLSQKIEKFVINQQGQQVKIEEEQMPGLSIGADDRTNSIIAKGVQNKVDKLRETIELLDIPGTGQGRSMTTVALSRVTPADAAAKLNQLYQQLPETDRPTVLALDDVSKIMILGDDQAITEGSLLIGELENGSAGEAAQDATVSVIPLNQAEAGEVIAALNALLSKRQQAAVKIVAGPDRKSLVVSGLSNDVAAVKALVPALDRKGTPDRQVRVVRIMNGEPQAIFDEALRVFTTANPDLTVGDLTSQPPQTYPDITLELNADARVVTVIGPAKSLDDFINTLRQIESTVVVERESRRLTLKGVRPSELVGPLNAIAPQLLQPTDGSQYIVPAFTAVDPLNALLVTATSSQLALLSPLIESLDAASGTAAGTVHVLSIANADAAQLAANLEAMFSGPGQSQPRPTIRVDAVSNSLLVRASEVQLQTITEVVGKIDKATIATSRQVRMFAVDPAKSSAEDVARTLQRMLDQSDPGKVQVISLEELIQQRSEKQSPPISPEPVPAQPASGASSCIGGSHWTVLASLALAMQQTQTEPEVTIAVDQASNSLVVVGSSRAVERVSSLVKQIQDQIPTAPGTVRYITLPPSLDATQLSTLLTQTLDKMSPRGGQPGDLRKRVAIIADGPGNALIIAANDVDFGAVADLLAVMSKPSASSFPIRTVTLQRADAGAAAKAIQQFFDDRAKLAGTRGSQQRRIAITGIESSNTLLISASDEDFAQVETLIAQFDTVEAAAGLTFRVFQLQHAKATEIERTVQNLVNDLMWSQGDFFFYWPPQQQQQKKKDSVAVRADARINALIVTGRGDKFDVVEQMIAMLDAPPPEGEQRMVRLYRVDHAPLQTVADVIRETFNQGRQRRPWEAPDPNEIKVRIDEANRLIIVSATAREQDEIKAMVGTIITQLNEISPNSGQAIFIIDLNNIPPETARNVIETIGLDKPQPADSATRLVSQPIKISLLPGRNAIVVVGNPADRETVVGLLKAIDAEPVLAEAQTRIVRLKNAQAAALSQILMQVLRPGEQQSDTPLAKAVREQVRRLAVRGPNQANGAAAELTLDLTKPVRVVADPGLNALVVSATADNLPALEQLIAMFDQLPINDAVTVQLFPLQNIAAEQFARIVRDMFAQGKQLGKTVVTRVPGIPEGAVGKALLNDLALSVDERTNTVIVAGSEEAVALVEVLSQRIDADVIAGWVEPKVLPLRFADAAIMASTLQSILVDGVNNLPQSSPIQRQIGRLRMARLHPNGDPRNVIEADVFTPMSRLVIKPDAQMNALILVGTPANIEVVSELVSMLDIEAASPANAVRIYPIENASAARISQTVRQLFDQQVQSKAIRPEDRVHVQADERTNALVVATSQRSFAVLESLLKALDSKLGPELREIRTIEVKNASAARLATMIQQMMDARMERLRKVQPETADLERATVIADPRTNSLLIAAGNDTFDVIKRLATDLDVDTLGDAALVHVIALEKGSIDRIAAAVNQVMERRYADLPADVRRSQRPLVLTDSRTNSLLVTAGPEDLASIKDLAAKLSAAPVNPAVGLHVLALPVATRAELVAPRVQRLMADRQASLGPSASPSDKVSVEPDPSTNSLIVAANDENLEIIRGLIDVLVQAEGASGAGREVEVVTLSQANRAADIADMLRDLYVQEANRTRGPNTVKVTADERLNALLINAPASDVRAIKGLIAQLEGVRPASVVEIKYVPLKSANAIETVSLIENVLSGRGIGARRGTRQATVLKYLREIARERTGIVPAVLDQPGAPPDAELPVEMEVSAAIRESITLTPDLRTNTIIVSAPRESITMIERMIRDLDESSTGSKNIRIFKLVNADAIAMAEILTELFKLKQGNSMYVLKPREDSMSSSVGDQDVSNPQAVAASPVGRSLNSSFSGTELTAVPDERQQLSITVDSRTNSLIVSGTATYLDLVAKVVEDLDKLEANEREVFVYQLRNSVAEEVARVVGQFVEREQQKLVGTLSADQLGSAARLLEREITIQGDRQSNTVLVSASPRYMETVKEMIRKLDVDPPQVLIQVMLAEVTLDSRDEWGVDLRAMAEIGGTTVTGGFGLANAFVTGLGVPSLAIASSDFDLLIRAMQAQGRLQVLSNPSIMAANNAPARIQVGETIQVPSSTSISDAGLTYTTLEKEDLGVILEVTPSINPDGFVRMVINPEISNLSARTTQISDTFHSPIITRRTADTTVTVHDGQTIVIGGLISDRFERRDRKVPFFGDLPVVGPLFRSNTEETAKTELLIVLTPHVIESPTEFDRVEHITEREIDRLTVPQEVKENIRRSLLDGTGAIYNSKGERIDVKPKDEGN